MSDVSFTLMTVGARLILEHEFSIKQKLLGPSQYTKPSSTTEL